MLYIDTSALVAAWTVETRTDDVQQWLAERRSEEIAVSSWTITEFSSAIALKARNGQIDPADRSKALALFKELCSTTFECLPISRTHFIEAARMIEQFNIGLHAGDALHLAIAIDSDATLVTLDKGLAKACSLIGARHRLL
ncbi:MULTISPECIES: type II toxin-antitoxin system VapC family toxin [Rhizobium]|uniref:type II toxin-antitoxin system VapC family toxin n=1 Tax=Rhizobium TaxID=379 RepID=UPI0007EAA5F7|nr:MULTISPECIES: type II toxin-antitoxin system VapC family toxin [Rhizobium]ANK94727.1 PilT domain-containing protein [Rhizobium sp. N6212]ANL00777.1 PilT domain-containing protein [Rhizobium sp. N621]ANL06898.1 PilT domain-containing protein [Rhizobium esperanzae]ANL13068.1 PilT domain-containing protein [Rhizobium sp. N1341]ANL25052.1 PilT domain-containing protein [Rhizobium sp. N113]